MFDFFFIECLKEIYANVFYTYSDFYYVPAHSFFRGLRVLSNFFSTITLGLIIKSHRSMMWKLDWFFNEIHLSCFILLNFSLLKQHEPILLSEIKCIGKQLWKQQQLRSNKAACIEFKKRISGDISLIKWNWLPVNMFFWMSMKYRRKAHIILLFI